MDADLLSDVVAVLDGDGVDKGGDLLVALLLLDHINSVLKLVLLGDLLGLGRSWHSPTGGLVQKVHKVITFDDEINPFSYFLVYQQYLNHTKTSSNPQK